MTVNSPTLVKLGDGFYQLVDVIDNCGGKEAGSLQITVQIDAGTTKQSTNLLGPATIAAHGKAMYRTFRGQTGETNKEIHFILAPSLSSAIVTVLVTPYNFSLPAYGKRKIWKAKCIPNRIARKVQ